MSQSKPTKQFLSKVSDFISDHHLLSKDGLHLVALSGGADSVSLLLALKQLGYRIEAIHCNFHLRGEESDRDEKFCEQLCTQWSIPFHRVHFETRSYADLHHVSLEMSARELRYRYFENLRRALNAEDICVAHHAGDNVETFLLNLLSGTGLHGLTGIKPLNGNVVRPLLGITRDEILNFLKENHQGFVIDSTNLIDDVKRNKIRLDLLPMMRQVNQASDKNIIRCIGHLSEVEKVYNQVISQNISDCTIKDGDPNVSLKIDLKKLTTFTSPSSILFEILSQYRFVPQQIKEIAHHLEDRNKLWKSKNYEALIADGQLTIVPNSTFGSVNIVIPEPGKYVFRHGENITEKITVTTLPYSPNQLVYDEKLCLIDFDKVHFPLTLRIVKAGDRIIPLGMDHSRLVNDLLSEKHLNLFQRRRQLVVAQKDGSIIWVVNIRIANWCRVTDSSSRLLSIKVE